MFSPLSVILTVCLYIAILFGIAQLVERKIKIGEGGSGNPWIYALSLAVYHTSWTFYGSVGFAAKSGLLYSAIYIGAFISILFWWITLKRMVLAKESYRITSIADFISTRYNRSQKIAALITIICMIGILPYIALQLKAVISSYELITDRSHSVVDPGISALLITLFMVAFTIVFGVRRLDPTERHQGMIAALVAECLVKLFAFMAIGLFVTYSLFDGFSDISQKLHEKGFSHVLQIHNGDNSAVMWMTLLILSFAAVQNLPRQFHVAVVENSNKEHIKRAMWVFPLYMLLINLFVIPIAGAGLLMGLPEDSSDFFVLLLPQITGNKDLTMLAFIGGFSAATGMIIITTMTLSTMASNHLILPTIEHIKLLRPLRGYLLQLRWVVVTLILLGSLWFAQAFSDDYILVSIGLLSFVAVLQFSPALLGGLFWKKGNSLGAFLGLITGFMIWLYCLLIPAFVKQGWFDAALMEAGPWHIAALRPEALFGLEGLHPVPHAVFWSLLFNIGFYIVGSLIYTPHKSERNLTVEFISAMISGQSRKARPTGLESYILLHPKLEEARSLLTDYLNEEKALQEIEHITDDLQVTDKEMITIIELVEFHRMLEHVLAGSIGSASAHRAIESSIRYNQREQADLQAIYSHIVTELGQSGEKDSSEKIEDQSGFGLISELQTQIDQLEEQISQQQQLINSLEGKLEQRYKEVFDYRLEAQKAKQDSQHLHDELQKMINNKRELLGK